MAKQKPPIGDTTGPAFLSEAIGDEEAGLSKCSHQHRRRSLVRSRRRS